MNEQLVFDRAPSRRIVEARQNALRPVIQDLRKHYHVSTAVDVGCGVGYFSAFLNEMGIRVTGLDGRADNMMEARRRYTDIQFFQANVETPAVLQWGSFDLVLCVGLLYHLENPLQALRNLAAIARTVLLMESFSAPGSETAFYLREEFGAVDESLTNMALYPSEASLIKICYRLGFHSVYRFTPLPDHEDFRDRARSKRLRTMLAASRVPLDCGHLVPVHEPPVLTNPWETSFGRVISGLWRAKRSIFRGLAANGGH